MLKRLIVLAAALAMVFVFASTSSAQQGVPSECGEVINNPTELGACLEALDAAGGEAVPSQCTTFLTTLPLVGDFTGGTGGGPVPDLLACLTAITGLDEGDEGYGYDDYGYDYGYDVGYDEAIPEGGVESGFGPKGSDAAGAPLAARGAALLALVGVLATGLLIMRRRHRS